MPTPPGRVISAYHIHIRHEVDLIQSQRRVEKLTKYLDPTRPEFFRPERV